LQQNKFYSVNLLDTIKTISVEKVQKQSRVRDLMAFVKIRLTFSVVLSAALGFGIAPTPFDLWNLVLLLFGGFLITGASNGFNQIIERDIDGLMKRTKNRPLPTGRMKVTEAFIIASLLGISGLILLYLINPLSAILGFLAFFIYVAVYTPLKKSTSLAVFVGAFPGAIPPMLGYVAANGHFGLEPGILFAVQFIWQFPHFWAIAWVSDAEYKKAGYHLLPSKKGKDSSSAYQMFLYSLFLIPVSLLPWAYGMTGLWSAIAITFLGLAFAFLAWKHTQKLADKTALRIMFASFIYLPVVQLLYLLNTL
jgi:protoheme IX farnesyltransferase